MARVPPLLLLVLLALLPGGRLIPTRAQDCISADIVVKEGETRTIKDTHEGGRFSILDVYVKAETGFEGLRLDVEGTDGKQYDVWFPAEDKCFPVDDKWYKLLVWATISNQSNTLSLAYETSACRRDCTKTNPPESVRSFSVEALGPSRWLLESRFCDVISSTEPTDPSLPSCRIPPASTTPITPLVLAVVIAVPVGVLVTLATVVTVVLIRRRRLQQKQPAPLTTGDTARPPQPTERASNIYTIENELYEPFDK